MKLLTFLHITFLVFFCSVIAFAQTYTLDGATITSPHNVCPNTVYSLVITTGNTDNISVRSLSSTTLLNGNDGTMIPNYACGAAPLTLDIEFTATGTQIIEVWGINPSVPGMCNLASASLLSTFDFQVQDAPVNDIDDSYDACLGSPLPINNNCGGLCMTPATTYNWEQDDGSGSGFVAIGVQLFKKQLNAYVICL